MYLNDYLEKYGVGNFYLSGFDEKGIPSLAINPCINEEWKVLEFTNWEIIQISKEEIRAGIKLIDAGYFASSPMGAKIQRCKPPVIPRMWCDEGPTCWCDMATDGVCPSHY